MSTVEIKKTTLITTSLIVVAMIVFIYWYHVRRIETEKIYIEDCNFKTGDLILFRTTQNFNSVFMANYFTHCGIIIEIEGTPYLFEANGVEKMHLLNHHNRAGIYLTPIKERIQKYKGYCYWKPIESPLSEEQAHNLATFAEFALQNFYYEYNILKISIKNLFNLRTCCENTNCGELSFLSLLTANLLDEEEYFKRRVHYLKYICDIEKLKNNSYLPIIQIIDHPFAD